MENIKRDYNKFYIENPKDFSPEKNKYIVEKTIKKYEQKKIQSYKKFTNELRERTHAIACYLKHLNSGKSTKLEKYFGVKELTRLRGQEVINQIRGSGKLIINNLKK